MTRFAMSAGLAAILCGCQQETQYIGPSEVRFDTPEAYLIGRASIHHEGRTVGTVRSYEFRDRERSRVDRIFDERDQPVGFVTGDGRAYRRTAHGGTDLVASSDDFRRNVATILGMPTAQVRITPEAGEIPSLQR